MKYDELTKYIKIFNEDYEAGEWVFDNEHKGTKDDPIHMPFVRHNSGVMDFIKSFYSNEDFVIKNYLEIMEKKSLYKGWLQDEKFDSYDETELLAALTYIVRRERFCEGYLKAGIESGAVTRILIALDEKYNN